MTNDQYIQQVATERGISVEQVVATAIAEYRSNNEPYEGNIYDDALYLQGAVNPRAVVSRFKKMVAAIVTELEAEYGHASTDDICFHPVFVLMVDKLQALGGYGYRYSEAYTQAIRKATPETLKLLGIEPREETA